MSAAVLPLAAESEVRRIRFSRNDVERMLDAGLLRDRRFELIEGELIDKMGQNPPHAGVIQFLLEWFAHLFGVRKVRVQLSLEVSRADRDRNMPEPDLAIVAEAKADYRRRHPRADETVLVVEVADTSLRQDLLSKRDLYARAGVPEYWVVSIPNRELIVHRSLHQGSYQQVTTLSENETVSIASIPEESIPVKLVFGDE
jgi:Uma2 family endonuclease